MMMTSDEEKRWIVVGIAMNRVAAPVLRDAVKQRLDTNYRDLDRHCQHLTPPCTIQTLTFHVVHKNPIFRTLEFKNINNNPGKSYKSYNFNINNSIDLAKLYLPGYLAQFSAFDDSMDMTAILHLLGYRNYKPNAVFSPPTQASADDVRKNVRNKWGHVDITEWTATMFNDCFDKLKTLVRSLGLAAAVEKNTLDQLDDWQMRGCNLIMGHAVDKGLLQIVQQEVSALIEKLKLQRKEISEIQKDVGILKDEDSCKRARLDEHHKCLKNVKSRLRRKNKKIAEIEGDVAILKYEDSYKRARLDEHHEHLENIKSRLRRKNKEIEEIQEDIAILKDKDSRKRARLDEHHKHLKSLEGKLQDVSENRSEEMEMVLSRLMSCEEKLSMRVQSVNEGLAKIDDKVEQLEQSQAKTDDKMEKLEKTQSETTAKVEQLQQRYATTDGKVEQMEQDVKNWMTQTNKPGSSMKPFDLKSCRSKLEDYYQKTATVPTSVWCKKSVVDINQIYTRLSLVKKEQTPAGKKEDKLQHYSDLFTANQNGVIPKRILVQGQTGIGKSTFVKKLLVDWVEVNKVTADQKTAFLKNFEIVVAVNLREVSKCQSLKDVIRLSNVFAKEDKYMAESLVDYITNNQEKVLVIFDGYDEYRCGRNSEIYEIFVGNSLRNCCVLITSLIVNADELLGGEDLHAEITGFSEVDKSVFMRKCLSDSEVANLQIHLRKMNVQELSTVPLLLLLFCTLWKMGQSEFLAKTKTQLCMDILQLILNHSNHKHSLPQYVDVHSFKDIFSKIGKVALHCLLKDDHLFEYNPLFGSARCDESVFISLLQDTNYSETVRPSGMVSFVHKSIQEFLAAWYVTFRYIPDGENLGDIGMTLEECLALKNVFQFICGLSDDAAFAVLNHLKSVRISDPSLDLSNVVPDVESKREVPLSDVTERQEKFSDLVLGSFEEVVSKEGLSSTCLDCLGGVLLLSTNLPEELFLNHSWSLVSYCGPWQPMSRMHDSVTFMNCIHVLLRVTQISEILKVGEFFQTVPDVNCPMQSVLCFRKDQVYLYIKHLTLTSSDHTRLFTKIAVPSSSTHSSFRQLHVCLKFLNTLTCASLKDHSIEGLQEVVKQCINLENIRVSESNDCLCYLLEQVPNPRGCSLSIEYCEFTSKGAAKLASLLSRFQNVTKLNLFLAECSDEAVTGLIAAIKHKTLEALSLSEINLSIDVAEAIGQVLPELSTLQTLEISGSKYVKRLLERTKMEALFGKFNSKCPLKHLTISHFYAKGSLAPLTNKMCFFPCLKKLYLVELCMNEPDFRGLLENVKFIPHLEDLYLVGSKLGDQVRSILPYLEKLKKLESVRFGPQDCSEEDLDYVQEAVKEQQRQLRTVQRKLAWSSQIQNADVDVLWNLTLP